MLRRMGFTQEGLETSGMGTSMVNPWQPNASDARRNEDFLFRSSTTSGAEGPCGRLGPRMENPGEEYTGESRLHNGEYTREAITNRNNASNIQKIQNPF